MRLAGSDGWRGQSYRRDLAIPFLDHGGSGKRRARRGHGKEEIDDDTCRYCGKTGHWARECRKKKRDEAQAPANLTQAEERPSLLMDVVTPAEGAVYGAHLVEHVFLNERMVVADIPLARHHRGRRSRPSNRTQRRGRVAAGGRGGHRNRVVTGEAGKKYYLLRVVGRRRSAVHPRRSAAAWCAGCAGTSATAARCAGCAPTSTTFPILRSAPARCRRWRSGCTSINLGRSSSASASSAQLQRGKTQRRN